MTQPPHTSFHAFPAMVLLAAMALASAASGPEHRSLRGLSMGNAHVAVVDDRNALHYNPAGLNLINALGNRSARPALANYPRNRMNARMNMIGMAVPIQEASKFWNFFQEHQDAFKGGSEFRSDTTFFRDMAPLDRRPIELGLLHGAEFAMHNFGAAYWADARVAPYTDVGVLLPQAGVERIQIDAVFQIAGARGLMNDRLAVGLGYRLANRQTVRNYQVSISEFAEDEGSNVIGAIRDTVTEKLGGLSDFGAYGHGIDLGVLWQQTPWLRLGASMQNTFMRLENEFVTPKFTVGAAFTPTLLSSSGTFSRKVNFAVDYEDAFNTERNYRATGKINFGGEVEQSLWWTANARLGVGFKGGYWTAGAGLSFFNLVHLEAVSWAEEAGYYTGHIEERLYAFNVGVGF